MNPLAAVGAVLISANPALLVTPSPEDHEVLLDSLQNAGIEVLVNGHEGCSTPGVNGLYYSVGRLLVICQQNAEFGDPETEWTAKDFHTLRHEAQHVIQDCLGEDLGDGVFKLSSSDTQGLMDFLDTIEMPEATRDKIIQLYILHGAAWPEIQLELEAFGVAYTVQPHAIAEEMNSACDVY